MSMRDASDIMRVVVCYAHEFSVVLGSVSLSLSLSLSLFLLGIDEDVHP